ncbi:hypothetical protein Bpla01_39410 [Burkholderia plantarii]|nr:hypothetical protein Bpla01_39410 [Burkholderia plantarii]
MFAVLSRAPDVVRRAWGLPPGAEPGPTSTVGPRGPGVRRARPAGNGCRRQHVAAGARRTRASLPEFIPALPVPGSRGDIATPYNHAHSRRAAPAGPSRPAALTARFPLPSPSNMTTSKYANLDAIRGVAAILIVFRHTPLVFASPHFQQSYLAVDLFFAISGFVVANAYEARLRSGSLSVPAFAKRRLIRLFPLYLIATAVGLTSYFVALARAHGHQVPSTAATAAFVALSLLMLPSRAAPLYPVNNPAWSLLYEILANLAYARALANGGLRVLLGCMVPAALVIGAHAWTHHNIDAGWDLSGTVIAVARVTFSFAAGVLLHRLRDRARRPSSAPWSLLALAVTALLLCAQIPARWTGPAVIVEVLLVVPLIVRLATSFEPPAALLPAFDFLGRTSYGLYILHVPMLLALARLPATHGHQYGKGALAVFVIAMLALVALLDRYVDTPVRARLSRRTPRPADLPIRSRV